jgi:hypothetical protein
MGRRESCIRPAFGDTLISDAHNKAIAAELKRLVTAGLQLLKGQLQAEKDRPTNSVAVSELDYQVWYSGALPLVRQLLPDRYSEFQEIYRPEGRSKLTLENYTISDALNGITIIGGGQHTPATAFKRGVLRQISILNSAENRLENVLSNIRGLLQTDLFDTELSTAEELLTKGIREQQEP